MYCLLGLGKRLQNLNELQRSLYELNSRTVDNSHSLLQRHLPVDRCLNICSRNAMATNSKAEPRRFGHRQMWGRGGRNLGIQGGAGKLNPLLLARFGPTTVTNATSLSEPHYRRCISGAATYPDGAMAASSSPALQIARWSLEEFSKRGWRIGELPHLRVVDSMRPGAAGKAK